MSNQKNKLTEAEERRGNALFKTVQAIMEIGGISVSRFDISTLCGIESYEVNQVNDKVIARVIQAYWSMINIAGRLSCCWSSDNLVKLAESLDLFYHHDGFFHKENLKADCRFLFPVSIQSDDFLENIIAPIERFMLNRHIIENQKSIGLALGIYLIFFIAPKLRTDVREVNFAPLIHAAFLSPFDNDWDYYIAVTTRQLERSDLELLQSYEKQLEQNNSGGNYVY